MISQEQYNKDNELISKAIEFAMKKHAAVINDDGTIGQRRKGSNLPYIIHPMEVWQILHSNNCSVNVQIAGLLHDTMEDAAVTEDEIINAFGKEILSLVKSESEDKSKSWKERKQATIDSLANESPEAMQVCCADKLSNCRAQYYDLLQIGDALFDRFNKESDPGLQSWYYHGIVDALKPLEHMQMYQESKDVVNKVYPAAK